MYTVQFSLNSHLSWVCVGLPDWPNLRTIIANGDEFQICSLSAFLYVQSYMKELKRIKEKQR